MSNFTNFYSSPKFENAHPSTDVKVHYRSFYLKKSGKKEEFIFNRFLSLIKSEFTFWLRITYWLRKVKHFKKIKLWLKRDSNAREVYFLQHTATFMHFKLHTWKFIIICFILKSGKIAEFISKILLHFLNKTFFSLEKNWKSVKESLWNFFITCNLKYFMIFFIE